MMNSFLFYTTKSMKEIIRSPMKFSMIFLLPIILVLSLSFIYGNQSVQELVSMDETNLIIGYVNNDDLTVLSPEMKILFQHYTDQLTSNTNLIGSPFSSGFFNHYRSNMQTESIIKPDLENIILTFQSFYTNELMINAVQNREISIGLVVDPKFSGSLLSGINLKHMIEEGVFLTNETEILDIHSTIDIIGDFSNSLFTTTYSYFVTSFTNYLEIYTQPSLNTGQIEIQSDNISRIEFTEFDSQMPGYLVFILILGISGSVAIIASERDMKTIDRMILSNYDKKSLILGIAFSQLIVTIVEIIMFLLTLYLIGFPLLGNPFLLIFVSLLSIVSILGLGFVIVAYIKDPYLAISIPTLLGIPLIFLAGAFIPLPYTPILGTDQIQIWHLNPLYSMSEAFRKIMLFGDSFTEILFELSLITIYGVVLAITGIKLLSKTIYKIE